MNSPQQIPTYKIASLAGDGIGTEVMPWAHAGLERTGQIYGFRCKFTEALAGGAAHEATGEFFPKETKRICDASDAILLGAVGGPTKGPEAELSKWKGCEKEFLLEAREYFNLPDNIRPVRVLRELAHLSSLKDDIVAGTDIEIHRELLGGLYYGKRETGGTREEGNRWGANTMHYTEAQIRALLIPAYESAMKRRRKLTVIAKKNVLPETGDLWWAVANEEHDRFPEVELDYMHVDNSTQVLLSKPTIFDVIATGNIYGDVLSDMTSKFPGSMGLMPSACKGPGRLKLYEPVHGSAPDIAGKKKANPIAMMASAAMMLEHSFGMDKAAASLRNAMDRVLLEGFRTHDLVRDGDGTRKEMILDTDQMGERIIEAID